MSLSNLTSDQFTHLVKLVKQKEALQRQLADLDSEINSLESGTPGAKRGRKPGRPPGSKNSVRKPGKRRGKRLKDSLIKLLQAAGAKGMTVKELAAGLGVKPGNVFSWFYTTGKKVSEIKKVGEAKYAYKA